MRIEQRGEIKVFLCSCCDLPFAKLQFGRLVVQSKHHSDIHSNSLGPDELESILELLRQADDMLPGVPPK